MATQDSSENLAQPSPEQPKGSKRAPLTEAQKKRLQKCCDHATKQMEQGNFDYATDLLTQCLIGEPGNLTYAQTFLKNLQKKHGNKKGGFGTQFKETGARRALKKALSQDDWDEVVKNAIAVLKVDPWDVPALTGMSIAASAILTELESRVVLSDTELHWLKAAFESKPKDPDVCRQVALALGKRQRYDEAIAFWHKVEQLRPGDEEAPRAVAVLVTEKTIKKTPQAKEKAGLVGPSTGGKPGQEELTPEEQLKRSIRREPNNLTNYHDLSQLYLNSEQYKEAEEVLIKAVKVSNNDPDVVEKLEDARLRGLRHRMVAAERRAKEAEDEETKAEAKTEARGLLKQIVKKELGVWKARCERYPTNLMFKYEVGMRHQMLGEYNEAIKEYQAARNDPRRKGVCLLSLGECFYHIKRFRLAMQHYELAIQEIPDRDAENKKKSLYRAGKLAFGLKDWDAAEKHLGTLAALDYSYRDVPDLLEEINRRRAGDEDGDEGAGGEKGN